MERIEMTRHDFAQHHSLRKFPQRSQSLRIKSSLPSIQRLTSKWNVAANRSQMPSSRLIISNQDLIVQDASLTSSPLSRSTQAGEAFTNKAHFKVKGKFGDELSAKDSALMSFNSMTLNRHESIRKRAGLSPIALGNEATTLFINCSLSPNTAFDFPSSNHNSQGNVSRRSHEDIKLASNGDNMNACSTFFEDTSVEDEGVITSFNEDYLEESDEEDYFDLEEIVDSQQVSSRQVHLVRHSQLGLGISIQGGSDISLPVIVSAIRAGSPADNSGLIYVGDQVVSVNEVALNETTCHKDALRLLSECGDRVCLVLKHSKAVCSFRRRWKKRESFNSAVRNQLNLNNSPNQRPEFDQLDFPQDYWKPFGRSSSVNCLSHYLRIDLFLAGITQYVTYSDKLRDSSFEICTSNGNSYVIQCSSEEISSQWYCAIKGTIDNLTDSFIKYFNKHYAQREHIFFMGWVSECLSIDFNSEISQHSSGWRWLSRFLIVKGGHMYLFKLPPVSILNDFKLKLFNVSRRNHSGSSGSSLGSVGSSGSDASNSSTSAHFNNNENNNSNDLLTKLRKGKPDRMIKLNKEFEKELIADSMVHFACYKSDFRCVKSNELTDEKAHCFILFSGTLNKRYFSTENDIDLEQLHKAWTRANYHSVTRLKNKVFTVEEENIFGSLILDWRFGFAFYDPKKKQYLWSYKFCQLKNSSDDGKSCLSLTFITDQNDSRQTRTHTFECSCLQTLIYCIHAFLSAKVYNLYI